MKGFASLMLMLAVLLLTMVPARASSDVFTDDSFSSPEGLDGVEIVAGDVRLKITPENWVQSTKADFGQRLNYENVAVVDPGDMKLASTGDEWSTLENAPYKSTYGITTTGAGDYIFIIKSYWADVKVGIGRYNTATGSWENWSNPTIEWQEEKQYFKNGCSMVWDNGGYMYVLAGGSYGDTLNPSDPTTNEPRYGFWRFSVGNPYSWERLENTPWHQGPGDALVWARVNGENYIYAWIGTTSKNRGRSCGVKFYRYSIHSEQWDAEPITEIGKLYSDNEVSPPYGADDGSSLVWTGGDCIYFLPGAYAENLPPNKERYFARFLISKNRWEDLMMLPYNENPNTTESDGVDDGGSMVWDGRNYLYVLKGGDGNGDNAADNFWRYSISSNSWEVLAGVPFGPSKNNGKRLGYAGENVYYWHANSTGFLVYAPPRYRRSGYFTSSVFDAGTTAAWQQISWDGSEPFGALGKKRLVSAEPENLIDNRGRLGVLTIHGLFDNLRLVKENPLEGYIGTSRRDSVYENISENCTASINQYGYVASHASVKGTIDGFEDQQSATDGGAYSSLHEQAYTVQVPTTEKINPSDDAYVGEDSPDTVYGSANSARLGTRTQTGANRRAFLKFDFSGIPTNAAITEAKLWLRVYSYSNPADEMRRVQSWLVTDDSWTEGTVTWNTQPNLAKNLDTAYIDGYKWFSWVVTDFVQDQFWSDNLVSFGIRHRNENLDETARTIYYRSKESDVDHPYLEVTYAVPRTHYNLEIHENIEDLPSGTNYTLQIRYKLSNANDKFRVMVKDSSGNWNYCGESLSSSTDWELWEYQLLDNEFIADGGGMGKNVRIKFVDCDNEATSATDLLIDYIRVKSTKADSYALRWEHRITDVENTQENIILRIYGCNATGDESVIASVWNRSASEWENFAENLPTSLGEITHRITNVDDYLMGDGISIKYEDADKIDDIQTTICIDHVVLEAQKPYSTALRVWARSSADNSTWSDWVENPSGDGLPWENRYFQYHVELSTTDSEVTPMLHELIAYYVPWTPRVGTFTSQALELGYVENWGISWEAKLPENTSISFATRSSPDCLNWSEWEGLESNAIQSPTHGMLYLQVRATLQGVGALTPTLQSYSITYTPERATEKITLVATVGTAGIVAAGVAWVFLRSRCTPGGRKRSKRRVQTHFLPRQSSMKVLTFNVVIRAI